MINATQSVKTVNRDSRAALSRAHTSAQIQPLSLYLDPH